jgi:2-iminoacetate synthase ThiH
VAGHKPHHAQIDEVPTLVEHLQQARERQQEVGGAAEVSFRNFVIKKRKMREKFKRN